MIERPRWLDYAIFEDVGGYPYLVGFKKGTPEEILEEYKEFRKHVEEAEKKGIML